MKIIERRRFVALVCSLLLLSCCSVAKAETATLTWTANTEADLAGYKIYQSTVSGQYGAPMATVGKVTTYQLTLPQLTVDTRYFFTITAYDLAGLESVKADEVSKLIAGIPVPVKPGQPVLTVTARTSTTLTVTYASVPDGIGGNGLATVVLRLAPTPISWGTATDRPCSASPCLIGGLTPGTSYDVQAVAYRGTPNVNAVYGPLSAVVSATTLPLEVPPVKPQGLQISRQTPDEIVIVAIASECPRVTTSTKGSTASQLQRTVTCVR